MIFVKVKLAKTNHYEHKNHSNFDSIYSFLLSFTCTQKIVAQDSSIQCVSKKIFLKSFFSVTQSHRKNVAKYADI